MVRSIAARGRLALVFWMLFPGSGNRAFDFGASPLV